MKLKNIPITEVVRSFSILLTLWRYTNYHLSKVQRYEDLSTQEKRIITKPFYNKYIHDENPETNNQDTQG